MAEPHGAPPPSAASGVNRLRGHLGHLTREESTALDSFRDLATQAGYYAPTTATKKASHDDGTLVRYLRARKFVPRDALEQFKDTEKWRKDNDLEALYERIDIGDYQEARSVYPQWTGRRDKRGIPVYLYEVGKLDSKKMTAYSSATSKSKVKGPSPSRMLRLFALYENLTRFVMPLCSSVPGRPNPETPVDQSNNIVDISNVGLKQFWNLRSHMQDASQLATAHYPETLDRIFIIGAPAFFPTVWGWIKKWFDPITTSKIFILSKEDVYPTLSAFIEHESIPMKYGGGLDFECGKLPMLDPPVRAALDLRNSEELFLTAPVRWVDDENGEMMALGVGSVDGHPHKERLAVLHSLARITLTRSLTHEGHPALSQASIAQGRHQASQRAVPNAIDHRSTPSSSRPQSRDQVQQTLMVPNVISTNHILAPSQATPPVATDAVDQAAKPASAFPDERPPEQEAPRAPGEMKPPAPAQPPSSGNSNVTDEKPTLLSYRPIDRGEQPGDTAPGPMPPQPSSQDQVAPSAQSGPPTTASNSSSPGFPPPTLTQKPAPLAERLHPHFQAPSSPPWKTLNTDIPHDGKVVNGKPSGLQMPQRPATLDRTETVYMTPPSEPSEIPNQYP